MELINWIWFAGAIASAETLGIADGKARNIQPIEALWLALLWVTAARKSDLPVVAGDQWQSFDVSVVPISVSPDLSLAKIASRSSFGVEPSMCSARTSNSRNAFLIATECATSTAKATVRRRSPCLSQSATTSPTS